LRGIYSSINASIARSPTGHPDVEPRGRHVESTTGAVVVGESQLLPPLSSGGAAIDEP
jgi:hypothetical protein